MSHEHNSTGPLYEVHFDPEEAVSLGHLGAGSTDLLRQIILGLPVVPHTPDPSGFDPIEAASFMGPGELTIRHLLDIISGEVAILEKDLARGVDFEVFISDANFRTAAKHTIFRLTPSDGRGGAILYGLRVQRIAPDQFAIWSDL